MKILIFSDSHLHDDVVLNIYEFQKPDLVLCLGDLGNKLNPAFKDFVIVKGNNDIEDFPKTLIYEFDGHKAFMTHGHYYNVEDGPELLVKEAIKNDCDYAIFGHTHQPMDKIIDNIHVINPGTVMFPRNGNILYPTYCVYEDGNITFYHAKKNEAVDIYAKKEKKKKETTNNEPAESFISKIIAFIKSLFK